MNRKKIIIIELACMGLFFSVLVIVATKDYMFFDKSIMNYIYSNRTSGLNTLMEAITYLGNWETIAIISILLLALKEKRNKYGYNIAIMAIVSSLINKVFKVIVHRPRPTDTMFLIEQGGYSFPSGHSTTALAVYGMLIFLVYLNVKEKKKRMFYMLMLALLIVLIGISRVYLGVHYPSDIIGGYLLGFAILAIGIWKSMNINKFLCKKFKMLDEK